VSFTDMADEKTEGEKSTNKSSPKICIFACVRVRIRLTTDCDG
jgi:hypothetical protein